MFSHRYRLTPHPRPLILGSPLLSQIYPRYALCTRFFDANILHILTPQSPTPAAHHTDEAVYTITDTSVVHEPHSRPVSPLRADREVSTDTEAISKVDLHEQFPFEDGMNQSTSKDCNLASTPPSPLALPPLLVAVKASPGAAHHFQEPVLDGAQPRSTSARDGGSLSVRSSFEGFSSEEEDNAFEPDTRSRNFGPDPSKQKTNQIPTPRRLSAQFFSNLLR